MWNSNKRRGPGNRGRFPVSESTENRGFSEANKVSVFESRLALPIHQKTKSDFRAEMGSRLRRDPALSVSSDSEFWRRG